MMNPALPVIDLGGGTVDPARPRVSDIAAALDEAFRRTGFCYIAGTGIDPALVRGGVRRFAPLPCAPRRGPRRRSRSTSSTGATSHRSHP